MQTKKLIMFVLLATTLSIAALLHVRLGQEPPLKNPSKQEQLKKKEQKPVEKKKEKTIKVSIKIIKEDPKPKPKKTQSKTKKPRKKDIPKTPKRTPPVARELVNKGIKMVGRQGEHLGEFPSFTTEYRHTIGAEGYINLIRRSGGRFFIFDTKGKYLVAEIDTASRRLKRLSRLSKLSPRSRDITSEDALQKYINEAARRHGPSEYAVVMLFPLKVDAFLIGAIEDYLETIGKNSKDFFNFQGRYERKGNDLILRVVSGTLKNGSKLMLNSTLNLSNL